MLLMVRLNMNIKTKDVGQKYTNKNLTVLKNIISLTGDEEIGRKAIGVHPVTFQKWKAEKEGLKELLEEAKDNYCKYAPRSLQIEALKKFHQLLTQGEVRICERRKIQKDANGNIIGETTEIIKEIKSPPRWVLERVLSKEMPIMDAMNLLISEGIISPKQSEIMLNGLMELQFDLKQNAT